MDRVAPKKSQCLAISTHLSIGNLKHERQGVIFMKEIWKDIPGYEGHYQVSNLGRVKSNTHSNHKKTKILKNIPRNGYLSVILCNEKSKKNVFVHRLVAQCFVPNPENKPIVNHIDGNKSNSCADNLEWCTHKENTQHAIINGLMFNGKRYSKVIYQFDQNGIIVNTWDSVKSASENLDISQRGIYNCMLGYIKTYKGYIWSKHNDFSEAIHQYKRSEKSKSNKCYRLKTKNK